MSVFVLLSIIFVSLTKMDNFHPGVVKFVGNH